ncbi:hypothetical protein [Fluviicola taffensis]|uniref:Beta-lactamase-inhibitor-like PepSY-like domain-containing protein n=1 Tax=Fluviicola taffensis (strain DSM 16823 / NCIMB 13979 / RW262) TaxID=755732 RepID=F2IBV0_FLUTR|nr:hypothetical protein [Fluviicola taffensis]AEA42178.1 hypothetical protein Fluta_0169 [Fluviicola taffensis DSM 16823]
MKKFIIAAVAITTTVFANAQAEAEISQVQTEIAAANPDRVQIKLEELPAGVQKALTTDAFQGWNAKTAYIIKAEKPYYEVELVNAKSEKNVVNFNEDGTVIKK